MKVKVEVEVEVEGKVEVKVVPSKVAWSEASVASVVTMVKWRHWPYETHLGEGEGEGEGEGGEVAPLIVRDASPSSPLLAAQRLRRNGKAHPFLASPGSTALKT